MTPCSLYDPTHRRPCRRVAAIMSAALVILLAGCASKPAPKSPQPEMPTPASAPTRTETPVVMDQDVATVTPMSGDTGGILTPEERAARAELERGGMVVYFDYDSSRIRDEFLPLLAAHGRYANRFRNTQVRLEGHTDERGSREYNIGLGERRAQAVKRALELQGVPASQTLVVSYGEERPEALGSSEASYSRNRRVEIRYSP